MLAIGIFILIIALVVVVHEWGHYIAAKKNGVLVHEFAVGMGPKIWSVKKGETVYSIRALPIGGFCSMEEEIGRSDNRRAMCSKKPWQKLVIISAGAVMNFVLAWFLLSLLAGYIGYGSNIIQTIDRGMPAEQSKLLPGDKIAAVNGIKVNKLSEITKLVQDKSKSYTFTIIRGEQPSFDVSIKAQWIEKEKQARFGFAPTIIHLDVLQNLRIGFFKTFEVIRMVWEGLIKMLTGQVGMNQVAGIVGIADLSAKQWDADMKDGGLMLALMNMIYIAAVISANLGVVNLLPIPALDGGRILFILIELLRGKPLDPEKESIVHFIGFVLLMLLTVVILYNDIVKVFNI